MKKFGIVLLLGVAVTLASTAASEGLRARLEIVMLKLRGEFPEVPMGELPSLLKPGAGFDLPALVESRNPYSSLQLPDHLAAASDSGSAIFEGRCATCHGAAGQGGTGPSLTSGERRHGSSDWAMFRVVRVGVPGTAMSPSGLSFDDAWRVIGRVRAFQRDESIATASKADSTLEGEAISDDDLVDERDDLWASYAGGWSGRRSKEMSELTARSLPRLRLAWAYQIWPDPEASQTTPVAIHGLLIVTTAQDVIALDQQSGDVVWKYHRELPQDLKLCCGRVNRGVAVFGPSVFVGTLDAHLLALDLATGRLRWDAEVASPAEGGSITGAPLIAGGRVITGVAGGEFGVRGFLDAYDPATGQRVWRFYTVPGAGEPGSASWGAGAKARGGGGGTWVSGAYDPTLKLVYWGVGNPSPPYAPDLRPGDNLYTCSAIAIDVETGKLRWSYQFSPNDSHDWDAAQTPVLTDGTWRGEKRPLILWANRNGFFYVLDRRTGEFLRATPFVKQTWNEGFDSIGRPMLKPSALPTFQGAVVYPGNAGGTNWRPSSYSRQLGLLFVAARQDGSTFFRDPKLERSDGLFTGGRALPVPGEHPEHAILALELSTGQVRWRTPLFTRPKGPMLGGLLTLGDRLVLGSEESNLVAVDASTGRRVWRRNLGGSIVGAPITFRANGTPRLAVVAGSVLFVFELDAGAT